MLTAEALPRCKVPVLGRALINVCRHYYQGGFVVRLVLMDMEFEKIKESFMNVEVNTTVVREHVGGEIERAIRYIKEHTRSVVSILRDM